jgi:hypothetical protein
LFPLLLGGAVGLGGILQGLHWRSVANTSGMADLETRLRIAAEENAMLKRENESLRSLAQGGGEVAVPREAIDRAEKEFGLRFLSNPVVHRIAAEELRDRVAAALESRFGPSGIDDRQEAWHLIGWLGPDDDLLAQLTLVRSVGARGWFDESTGEAWVTDNHDPESIPDQAALVRLLARILLHQNFPPPPAYPGDDAARAREALHHGAAAGAEARFYAMGARTIGFMPMQANKEVQQLFNSLPPFIQGLTTFPAMEGKGLADTLHVQGNEVFQKAFRNPPQTTRAILQPAWTSLPRTMEMPSTPEEPYLSESAGQLGLRLWLEPLGDVGAASEISSCWENDRYLFIPDGEASAAVIWDIQLETKEAADRLQAAALNRVAAMAELKESAELAMTIITAEKRHLRITRPAANRVRFLNTATPELAAKFNQAIP